MLSAKDLVALVHQKAYELEECDTQDIEEAKRCKKKALKEKKAELTKKETELKNQKIRKPASKSNASTSDDDDVDSNWELVNDVQEQVDDIKDDVKDLEAAIKELEAEANSFRKAQQATCKKLEPCTRILQLAVEICCTTFREQVAEEEKSALRATLESFRTNICKPMSTFMSMTQQAKSMFMECSSVSPPLLVVNGSSSKLALQDAE
ncbi:unnamed protein product [Symbiodinium pilosum]|uniref:Uncharacterized protein n=1 Tax=Symbiodinium pilosum TaxID=2952 RepID=A0A812W9G6_SYMPI|nr:unnamed protein product [Symbiodinium pilosum]